VSAWNVLILISFNSNFLIIIIIIIDIFAGMFLLYGAPCTHRLTLATTYKRMARASVIVILGALK
jgi:hypothetical protein